MEVAITETDVGAGEVQFDNRNSEAPQVDSAIFRTETDILITVANHSGISQSHRRDAISAIHLFRKFDKEVIVTEEVAPTYQKFKSIMHHTWNIICYILQKRILESCEQNGTEAPLNKIRLRQALQSKEIFSDQKENNDLMQYGKIFTSFEKPIHSIVALYACANISKLNARGDSSVDQIQKCSWLLTFACEKLADDKNVSHIVTHHLIPFLSDELTRFIRSVQTSCHKFRTENEAWCVMRMGICYGCFGDDTNFALMCENAASMVRRKFKKDARFHQVYATCLSNAATAYIKCRNIEKAQDFIIKSTEAYEKVKDWQGNDKEYALSVLEFNRAIKQNVAANIESQGNILETDL